MCLNNGICYDTYGSFICECTPNFAGFNCEQLIDSCTAKDCPRDTICFGGQCCEPDSSGNQCKPYVHDCKCLNGGTCDGNSTVCICPNGYEFSEKKKQFSIHYMFSHSFIYLSCDLTLGMKGRYVKKISTNAFKTRTFAATVYV